MAKERQRTRNQIMTQSAMAQLAQANAMPQNVLGYWQTSKPDLFELIPSQERVLFPGENIS